MSSSFIVHVDLSLENGWHTPYGLIGLVVKASVFRAEDPGFDSCLPYGDISRSSHTSDLKLALRWLPCQVWRCRVNAGTGWPGVSIL